MLTISTTATTGMNSVASSSNKTSTYNRSPRNGTHEKIVDISMLDVTALDDYLSSLKSKTENNIRDLWKETCLLAQHLKATRELMFIGSNLIYNRSGKAVITRLLEVTHILLNAEVVCIFEGDQQGKDLHCTHAVNESLIGVNIPINGGIEGDVYARRISANIPDVEQDPRYQPLLENKIGYKLKSLVCAPIVADGHTYGVIFVANKCPTQGAKLRSPREHTLSHHQPFTANEALLIGFVATNAALALKAFSITSPLKRSLHSFTSSQQQHTQHTPHTHTQHTHTQQQHKHLNQHSNVNNLSKKLNKLENDRSVIDIVDMTYHKLDAERVSVFIYSPISKSLLCIASQDIKGFSIPYDKGYVGLSFTSMHIVNISESHIDERHYKEIDKHVGFHTKNVLCAPIIDRDNIVLGVIQAVNKRHMNGFNSVDESILQEICKKLGSIATSTTTTNTTTNSAVTTSSTATCATSSLELMTCIGNITLSRSIETLIYEYDRSIEKLTIYDIIGIYTIYDQHLVLVDTNTTTTTSSTSTSRWLVSDLPQAFKQVLQYQSIIEVNNDTSTTSTTTSYTLPSTYGIDIDYGYILPIQQGKLVPTQLTGQCMIVVGKKHTTTTTTSTATTSTTKQHSRDIIELLTDYFNKTLISINTHTTTNTTTINNPTNTNTTSTTNNLNSSVYNSTTMIQNILQYSLHAIGEYVIVLNKQGEIQFTNKPLETLCGTNNTTNTTNTNNTTSISHIHNFFKAENCNELYRDIESAIYKQEMKAVIGVKFLSTVYPEGVKITYQIQPITANNVKNTSGTSSGTSSGVGSSSKGIGYSSSSSQEVEYVLQRQQSVHTTTIPTTTNTSFDGMTVIIISIEQKRFNERSMLRDSTPMIRPEDCYNTAHDGIQFAIHILNTIQDDYLLDNEVKYTLKQVLSALTLMSQKASVATSSPTALHQMQLTNHTMTMPLVNPTVILPNNINDWEFDVLTIKDSLILCNIIGKLFDQLISLNDIGINESILARYIVEVGRHYHDRPFHNLQHATCVTHFTYMLIKATDAINNLREYQIFGILLSAVVHDVDHPGNTNLFEINSGSELAIRYNDQSVLENHHCSTAFRLMRKPNLQVLANLPKAVALEIRKTIISCVMATDMAVHFELIDETKKRALEGWNFAETKDQALLGKILLHAADLSNPVRPFHMTRQWAERISIEFNEQVAREQELGMPVLGFMMTPDEKAFCKNETGFASFVVAPMWRALANLYPDLTFLVEQLDRNLVTWKALLEKLQLEEQQLQENTNTIANTTNTNTTSDNNHH